MIIKTESFWGFLNKLHEVIFLLEMVLIFENSTWIIISILCRTYLKLFLRIFNKVKRAFAPQNFFFTGRLILAPLNTYSEFIHRMIKLHTISTPRFSITCPFRAATLSISLKSGRIAVSFYYRRRDKSMPTNGSGRERKFRVSSSYDTEIVQYRRCNGR